MRVEDWVHGQLGTDIWNKKYKNEDETFDEWLDRVSTFNNKVDKDLRKLMLDKKFLFGGRILANRGLAQKGKKITYSNCFVIAPPEDNLESIYETASKMARTYSYGGGVGTDLSKLRPKDAKTNNAANFSTGAVSFMELYDMTTGLISQQGRRGALMLSISCDHPDLEDFIDIKTQTGKITKANISIKITDDFMRAVENNKDWELKFTVPVTGEKISKTVNARDLMYKIAKNNHEHAEPGFLFWSTIDNWNLLSEDDEFEYAGVNPCAEEPLPAGGSCILGSLNLSEFVKNSFSDNSSFDFDEFSKGCSIAIRALNEILDEGIPLLPLEEQRISVSNYRQIGLGPMGIADMFIKLGLKYGSEESIEISEKIAKAMINASLQESALLARKYGVYPKFRKDKILSSAFLKAVATEETINLIEEFGLRNSQLLTCAPTGTISTMLGISGGIEPIFNYSYSRKTESLHGEDVYYKVYTPIVETFMKENSLKAEEELPDFFNNAMTLHWENRIKTQAIWQKHIDASISSTVNLPEETTVEEIINIYTRAWELGLKGITIYRDNCARAGILVNEEKKEDKIGLERGAWASLPEDIVYYKRKLKTGCGKLNIFLGYSHITGKVHDIYAVRSGSGGCEKSVQTTIIAMAGMLRLGGDIFNIEKAFNGLGGCSSFVLKRAKGEVLSKGSSCGTAVLFEIKQFIKDMEQVLDKPKDVQIQKPKKQLFSIEEIDFLNKNGELEYIRTSNKCPLCNEKLLRTDGCISCTCGFTKCD